MLTTQVDLTADTIDVRDLIARVEQLETEQPDSEQAKWDNCDEYATLLEIMDDLKGNGGDEQWRGDWYPVTLISERTFEDHARELLEECGTIPRDLPWYVAIDWETTAQHIQGDYTSVEIDGTTYWYR